jgi:hypothetical protein
MSAMTDLGKFRAQGVIVQGIAPFPRSADHVALIYASAFTVS